MEVSSTFKNTINEFCDVANWMTENIYNWRCLEPDKLHQIKNKLDALQPIADKYNRSFRTGKIILEKDMYLKLEHAASSLWNSISITIKTEQQTMVRNTTQIAKSTTENASNLGNNSLLTRNIFLLCCCKRFATVLFCIFDALVNTLETQYRIFNCQVNLLKTVLDCLTQEFLCNCSAPNGEIDNSLENNYNLSEEKRNWDHLLHTCLDAPQQSLKKVEDITCKWEDIQIKEVSKLKMEFFLSNFQICLKEGDIQTAKIYSTKVNREESLTKQDPSSLIELCRVIFNSILLYSKKYNDICDKKEVIYLLKVALGYLNLSIPGLTSHVNYTNMKYTITVFLTKYSIENFSDISTEEECDSLTTSLQEEFSKKIEPYKLAIKYNQVKKSINCDSVNEEIIMRMVTNLDLAIYWDQILECIGELAKTSTSQAIICLEYIFINKLDPQKDIKIWEDLIVARIFLTTEAKDMSVDEIILSLESFIVLVKGKATSKLSEIKISSIVTLLWNFAKRQDKREDYKRSSKVYQLAQNDLFCDDFADIGKITRALISALIYCGDTEGALCQYERMSELDKSHPLTQLLLIKIHKNQNATEEIISCLNNIKLSEEKSSIQILILAISLCKQSDEIVIEGMEFLLEKLETGTYTSQNEHCDVPLLELIRYTLQLTIKLLEVDMSNWDRYCGTLKGLLHKAINTIRNILKGKYHERRHPETPEQNEIISIDEIEWFASIAYNIAAKGYNEKRTEHVSSIVQAAEDLSVMIPSNDVGFAQRFHFEYWRFKIKLLRVLISYDCIQQNKDGSSQIDSLISSLDKNMEDLINFRSTPEAKEKMTDQNQNDLTECFHEFLKVQFNCILATNSHQKINSFTEQVLSFNDLTVDEIFVQLMTSNSNYPRGTAKNVLMILIKRNITDATMNNIQLCLWTRLFLENISQVEEPSDADIVLRVLKKFQHDILTDPSCLVTSKEKIELMCTQIWNIGVNLIISGKEDHAVNWFNYSMNFAKLVNDGLKNQLRDMYYSLIADANIQNAEIEDI